MYHMGGCVNVRATVREMSVYVCISERERERERERESARMHMGGGGGGGGRTHRRRQQRHDFQHTNQMPTDAQVVVGAPPGPTEKERVQRLVGLRSSCKRPGRWSE